MSQPSSPVLKARKQSQRLYSKMLYSLLVFCLFIWMIRLVLIRNEHRSHAYHAAYDDPALSPDLEHHFSSKGIPPGAELSTQSNVTSLSMHTLSLTAILPVSSASISELDSRLTSLLGAPAALVEIIILAPRTSHPRIRNALRNVLSKSEHIEVELSISPLPEGVDQGLAVIQTAQRATTDWVLLVDENALKDMGPATRDLLLLKTTPSTFSPIGPRGFDFFHNGVLCSASSSLAQNVAYLVPPLVLPTSALPSSLHSGYHRDPWVALGQHVAGPERGLSAGLVVGSSDPSALWCQRYAPKDIDGSSLPVYGPRVGFGDDSTQRSISTPLRTPGSGAILLATHSGEEHYVAPIACGLVHQGHNLTLLVIQDSDIIPLDNHAHLGECQHAVNIIPILCSTLADPRARDGPLATIPEDLDVIITAMKEDSIHPLLHFLTRRVGSSEGHVPTIRIPREDLPYCDWMAALTLKEWKNWHIPQIELSVITDSRPHSLRRLLSSLTNARYFGDSLNLRLNVEQTGDPETLGMVREYEWNHGDVFLHHRVVHGGLMAAVVESWYPRTNDSYGLILEDDVELSPLFYAWAKMSLLRYRYGGMEDRSPNLFGISLYQQKNLELHPEGRHLFDARHAFKTTGLAHPSTPYLSQIPCSWGALYFPEHWREFHAYLVARLAGSAWPLAAPVVPGVRSNRWTRSWKKYFIELVYLRGYVMLYPNYADFRSLSTNHLETGSHVKDIPAEAYLRKKKLFNLPLMSFPPPPPPRADGVPPSTGLLELPDARLPEWGSLPVLDLLGTILDGDTLVQRGRERRLELTGCDGLPTPYDVPELLCMH